MNPIDRLGSNPLISAITSSKVTARSTPQTLPPADSDTVELSSQPLSKAFRSGEIRQDKVAAIRKQLDEGTYDEDSKLDAVADKLLDALS